jgi:hypothetical protein
MASLDGLSTDMLRTSRAAWWDDAFTRRLLDAIPSDTASIVDVGCGLASARSKTSCELAMPLRS